LLLHWRCGAQGKLARLVTIHKMVTIGKVVTITSSDSYHFGNSVPIGAKMSKNACF
jgi:hypothetical protein